MMSSFAIEVAPVMSFHAKRAAVNGSCGVRSTDSYAEVVPKVEFSAYINVLRILSPPGILFTKPSFARYRNRGFCPMIRSAIFVPMSSWVETDNAVVKDVFGKAHLPF